MADWTQDANCVLAYLMDNDCGGSDYQDDGANNLDATPLGDGQPDYLTADIPTTDDGCSSNYAAGKYQFDGSDDYFDIDDNAYLDSAGNASVIYWLRYDKSGGYTDYAMFVAGDADPYWGVFFDHAGGTGSRPQFLVSSGGSTTNFYVNARAILNTEWQHCAWIWNGASWMEFYLEGVSQAVTRSYSGTLQTVLPNVDASWRLGVFNSGANAFDGGLTEFAIFSDSLSSVDVNDIMDNGLKQASGSVSVTVTPNAIILYLLSQAPSISITYATLSTTVSPNPIINKINALATSIKINTLIDANLLNNYINVQTPTVRANSIISPDAVKTNIVLQNPSILASAFISLNLLSNYLKTQSPTVRANALTELNVILNKLTLQSITARSSALIDINTLVNKLLTQSPTARVSATAGLNTLANYISLLSPSTRSDLLTTVGILKARLLAQTVTIDIDQPGPLVGLTEVILLLSKIEKIIKDQSQISQLIYNKSEMNKVVTGLSEIDKIIKDKSEILNVAELDSPIN